MFLTITCRIEVKGFQWVYIGILQVYKCLVCAKKCLRTNLKCEIWISYIQTTYYQMIILFKVYYICNIRLWNSLLDLFVRCSEKWLDQRENDLESWNIHAISQIPFCPLTCLLMSFLPPQGIFHGFYLLVLSLITTLY